MSSDEMMYLINHLFLPLHLPQSDDGSPENDKSLLALVKASLEEFEQYASTGDKSTVALMKASLNSFIFIHDDHDNTVSQERLKSKLLELATNGAF